MIRSRRHLLALWIGLLCLGDRASALGLGDVQVNSHLGEPLDAQVQLLDQTDDDLRIAIGQQGDYQALGIEYSSLHEQLNFEPEAINGEHYLRIRSDAPVHEPYLDFVLRLRNKQGQLIREVTILLDPRPQPGGNVAQPAQIISGQAPGEHSYRLSSQATAAPALTRGKAKAPPVAAGWYSVKAGDSLWKIAAAARPSSFTQEETMSAILALNPGAFIANDPARLMMVAHLQLPSAQRLAELRNAAASVQLAAAPVLNNIEAATPTPMVDGRYMVTVDAVNLAATKRQLVEFQTQKAELKDELQRLSLALANLNKRLAQANSIGDLYSAMEPTAAGSAQALPAQDNSANLLSVLVADAKADPAMPFVLMSSAQAAQSDSGGGKSWWNMIIAWAALIGFGVWVGLRVRAKKLQLQEHLAWPVAKNWKELQARDFSALTEHSHEPANFNLPLSDEPEAISDIAISMDRHTNVKTLAAQLTAFGRYQEAEQLIMSSMRIDPDVTAFQLLLLNIYLQTNRLEPFRKLEAKLVMQKLSSEEIMQLRAIKVNYSARYSVNDPQVKYRRVI